ncbi:MAG: polyprenyl synthetase family protein [Bacteroidales bacterium]|nr:polyprenyl synthetase family protein [Bacteroidales bacterium]
MIPERFEKAFAAAMSSDTAPMEAVLRYVAGAKGKRLRPELVYLTARLFGEVNQSTDRTALFVEMIHTATLIHDDVVDASDERRGQASVNARWDNTTAVLAGDFLLSKAMLLLSHPEDHAILEEMLQTTLAMSEGELMQNGERRTENGELYLEIIERKTAQLIRACCVGGAMTVLSDDTEDRRQKLEWIGEFGLNLGLVFQMRDDILDADNAEHVAMAELLLPEYIKKALKALEALTPFVTDQQALSSLKELIVFCAERNH